MWNFSFVRYSLLDISNKCIACGRDNYKNVRAIERDRYRSLETLNEALRSDCGLLLFSHFLLKCLAAVTLAQQMCQPNKIEYAGERRLSFSVSHWVPKIQNIHLGFVYSPWSNRIYAAHEMNNRPLVIEWIKWKYRNSNWFADTVYWCKKYDYNYKIWDKWIWNYGVAWNVGEVNEEWTIRVHRK